LTASMAAGGSCPRGSSRGQGRREAGGRRASKLGINYPAGHGLHISWGKLWMEQVGSSRGWERLEAGASCGHGARETCLMCLRRTNELRCTDTRFGRTQETRPPSRSYWQHFGTYVLESWPSKEGGSLMPVCPGARSGTCSQPANGCRSDHQTNNIVC
jgi:hypothetical protein